MLVGLNSDYIGVDKMKTMARLSCWWPELNTDIQNTVRSWKDQHSGQYGNTFL